jgi:hypothetical protein
MATTASGKKEIYGPNKLPLLWMMLTGGIAGSIAEVYYFISRLQLFLLIQQRLDYNCKGKVDKLLNILVC